MALQIDLKYGDDDIVTLGTEGQVTSLTTNGKLLEENIIVGVVSGGFEDISTEAEMDAKLTTGNYGKTYRYVGTTTTKYENGGYYEVVDNYVSPIVESGTISPNSIYLYSQSGTELEIV